MGVAIFLPRPRDARFDAGPIGSWKRRHEVAVSTIRFDKQANAFVYGDEVGADLVEVTHDFLRKAAGRPRRVAFTRREIRIGASASQDVKAGGRLFLSEMPVGQRRVHEALIQTYARDALPAYFEDFPDLPDRLGEEASQLAISDDEAVAVLQQMRVNLFETDKKLVAGFVTGGAGAFASYDDESPDEPAKRRETKLRLADATYSIGAAADPAAIHAALWQDKDLSKMFELAGDGRLTVKGSATSPEVRITLEVGSRAAGHLDIAIRQAMAGGGEKADGLVGKPVARYARWMFERHLLAAQTRFSGRIPPLDEFNPEALENLPDDRESS